MLVVTRCKSGRATPRGDAGAGINSWFMGNHILQQSNSLRKAAKLQALGSRGKYHMTKAERRRLKDREKRARTLLEGE
jgi:hypothetical protein